jgi:hypothetical protein
MNRKEYLSLLAVGVILTYTVDDVSIYLITKASEEGFFDGGIGGTWALFWTVFWLVGPVISFFHFYLKLSFFGFLPILVVTLIVAYPLFERLKRLKFFIPLLLSTGISYIVPFILVCEFGGGCGRWEMDWMGISFAGIMWAIEATIVTHLVRFVLETLRSRK